MKNAFLHRSCPIEFPDFKEIQFYLINLKEITKEEVHDSEQFLDEKTLTHIQKTLNIKKKQQSTITHSILRHHLSSFLNIPPQKIHITRSEFGKPYLKNHSFQFNISYTQQLALMAFHPTQPIGIDMEWIHREIDHTSLINTLLTPEEKAFIPHDSTLEKDHFFSFWCAKEALLKALGTGFLVKELPKIYPKFKKSGYIDSFTSEKNVIYIDNEKVQNHKIALCILMNTESTSENTIDFQTNKFYPLPRALNK